MSYTKKRTRIKIWNIKSNYDIEVEGILETELRDISDAEIEIDDLNGTYKTTTHTDREGRFKFDIDEYDILKDHNYLFRIAYKGDEEHFGVETKVPVLIERKPTKIHLCVPKTEREYKKDVVKPKWIEPQKEYQVGSTLYFDIEGDEKYLEYNLPLQCLFNGIKTILVADKESGIYSFDLPVTNVNNRNCRLVINFAGNNTYASSKLEISFNLIAVNKITYLPPERQRDSAGWISFRDLDNSRKCYWKIPQNIGFHCKRKDKETEDTFSIKTVGEQTTNEGYYNIYIIFKPPWGDFNNGEGLEYAYLSYDGLFSDKVTAEEFEKAKK